MMRHTFLLLLVGCHLSKVDEKCEAIRGEVLEGKEIPLLVAGGPAHKVVVALFAETEVDQVRIATDPPIQARLTDVAAQKWETQIFATDLQGLDPSMPIELTVEAVDRCDTANTIDTLRLNSAPNLVLAESHAGDALTTCYLPTERVDATITVTSATGAGAKVKLTATKGTFSGGAATEEAVLDSSGTHRAFFVPSAAGIAAFTATALGGSAEPLFRPVVPAPTVVAPATALQRDLDYAVTFDTGFGNFRTCSKDETVAGATTVTLLDPDRVLASELQVAEPQPSCSAPEVIRARVRFGATAPNNAQVTVACTDAYGRVALVTLSVVQQ